jgi:hypothetical protein
MESVMPSCHVKRELTAFNLGRRNAGEPKSKRKKSNGPPASQRRALSNGSPSSVSNDEPDSSKDKACTNIALKQWASGHGIENDKLEQTLKQFEKHVQSQHLLHSPPVEMLTSVIKFNLFRALKGNNESLGFGTEWRQADGISPFFGYKASSEFEASRYPANLRPILLQNTVEHHPWIDLLPLPAMRENILSLGEAYDDEPLCHDILEDLEDGRSGLIVWGDPWEPASWEITEGFARKWFWVLRHCVELFAATNMWRVRRGESKLFSDALCRR